MRSRYIAKPCAVLLLTVGGALTGCVSPAQSHEERTEGVQSLTEATKLETRLARCIGDSLLNRAIRDLQLAKRVAKIAASPDSAVRKLVTSIDGTTAILVLDKAASAFLEVESDINAQARLFDPDLPYAEARVPAAMAAVQGAFAFARYAALLRGAAHYRDSSLLASSTSLDSAKHAAISANNRAEAEAIAVLAPSARLKYAALYNKLYADAALPCP